MLRRTRTCAAVAAAACLFTASAAAASAYGDGGGDGTLTSAAVAFLAAHAAAFPRHAERVGLVVAAIARVNSALGGSPAPVRDAVEDAAAAAVGAGAQLVRTGTVVPVGGYEPVEAGSCKRRQAVVEATREAWDAYEKHAWGFDEVNVVTKEGVDTFAAGLGTTIVDSLSTLYIMGGLDGRYKRARDWVDKELRFEKVGRVIVFETVIRMLGGLISIYQLTGDEMYARRAEELGARLAVAFDTAQGLPWSRCFLNETGRCETHSGSSMGGGDTLYLAEVGTVQLEYRALAHHSRAPVFAEMRSVVEEIVAKLQAAGRGEKGGGSGGHGGREHKQRSGSAFVGVGGGGGGPDGNVGGVLLPFSLSLSRATFGTNLVTLGSPADSYFEYVIKAWVQGGRQERAYWELFAEIADAIGEVVAYRTADGDVILRDVYLDSTRNRRSYALRQDHFTCFLPGALVLALDGLDMYSDAGANSGEGEMLRHRERQQQRRETWERLAADVTETCYKMYSRSPSGLAGEHVRLARDQKSGWRMSGGYKLRPEAIEAMFYMWRHTRDPKYRQWGWEIFEAMRKWCRVESDGGGGFATLKNAKARRPVQDAGDAQPSFLIAETFKYLYLLFGDDENELPLDRWVFNTEAHPLLVTPGMVTEESLSRLSRLAPERNVSLVSTEEASSSGGDGIEGVCSLGTNCGSSAGTAGVCTAGAGGAAASTSASTAATATAR